MNYTNFKVQQLSIKNLTSATEAIGVFMAAVIANMLIPQLLLKYVYDPATLFEAPPIFEYLPLGLYGFAVLFFLYAMFGNFTRSRKIRTLQHELAIANNDGQDDEITDEELKELERIVDEALKPKKKTVKRKKTATKTKATKKKTATKKSTKKSKK